MLLLMRLGKVFGKNWIICKRWCIWMSLMSGISGWVSFAR